MVNSNKLHTIGDASKPIKLKSGDKLQFGELLTTVSLLEKTYVTTSKKKKLQLESNAHAMI